jgi:hypothetical protein
MSSYSQSNDFNLSSVVFYVSFSVCVCFYLFLILPIPGEYLGDSQEYLHLGAALRNLTFSYNYMRGLLYPAFIALTWNRIGLADSSYLIQIILFLVALYLFCRSTLGSNLFALPVLFVAISPAIAYLQKLAYADGFLLSLTLLYVSALARLQYRTALIWAVALAATKLAYAFAVPLVGVIYLYHHNLSAKRLFLLATIAAGVALPLLALPFDYIFPDLAYIVALQRPPYHSYDLDQVLPSKNMSYECGGKQYEMPYSNIDRTPITKLWQFATYGPLTLEQTVQQNCSARDLRIIKRTVVWDVLSASPLLHIGMGYQHFAAGLAGVTLQKGHHSSYMLLIRERAMQEKLAHGATYLEQEAKIAQDIKENGISIRDDVPDYLYLWHGFYRFYFESSLRLASVGIVLGVLGLSVWRKKALLDVFLSDPVVVALLGFLIPYSAILAISAPFLYDRYTSINFFLFVAFSFRMLQIYAARSALQAEASKDRALLEGGAF